MAILRPPQSCVGYLLFVFFGIGTVPLAEKKKNPVVSLGDPQMVVQS